LIYKIFFPLPPGGYLKQPFLTPYVQNFTFSFKHILICLFILFAAHKSSNTHLWRQSVDAGRSEHAAVIAAEYPRAHAHPRLPVSGLAGGRAVACHAGRPGHHQRPQRERQLPEAGLHTGRQFSAHLGQ